MAKLIFKDAEDAKNAIMDSQKKEIEALYQTWSDDLLKKANKYAISSAPSSVVSEMQVKQLMKQMEATGKQVANEVNKIIKDNMYIVADDTVKCNAAWLSQFGFAEDGVNAAFSSVPGKIVERLVTGQIYEGKWNLSKKIWGDNEQTMKNAYQIVAKGLAENSPIQNIAEELANLVDPSAKKSWNPVLAMKNATTGEIEYKRIYRRKVDYNAQRLARTLVQHSYQQSFVAVTKNNPFVTEYIWHSNGSRVCELCSMRDGVHFEKNKLPMDHPNGMCIIEPAVADDMNDKLADWFNSVDGTYPEIDEFAKNFDYEAIPVKSLDDFIKKYGISDLDAKAWYNSLTPHQKAEAKYLKQQTKLTWEEWYKQNIYDDPAKKLTPTQEFIKKWGTSDKSPTAWYNGLSAEQKAEAKILKEKSGLTWKDWYEKNVFEGAAKNTSTVSNAAASIPDDVSKKIKNLEAKIAKLEKELNDVPFSNHTFSGIWKDPVTIADYEDKMHAIPAKKKYFTDALKNPGISSADKFKFELLIDDLEMFENYGKEYAAINSKLKPVLSELNSLKFTAKGTSAGSFDASMYTDEAKAAAKKFSSRNAADKYHRPYLDEVWKNSTDKEHYSVWEYTQNSNPINKSLSGYHDDWSRSSFLGLGKTDLGHEDPWRRFNTSTFTQKYGVDGHKDYKSVVQNLTNIIDKSELQDHTYFVRGSDKNGFAGILEGDLFSYEDAMKILRSGDANKIKAAFEGQTFTNHAYTSTGIASGTGFSGEVKYEIFAPKGTKCIYAEPTSYFGDTVGMQEKIYKVGQSYSSIGGEAEMIFQRGTDFRITKIDVDTYGNLSVKMEVVNQPDYFVTGLEHTHNGGATSYKK